MTLPDKVSVALVGVVIAVVAAVFGVPALKERSLCGAESPWREACPPPPPVRQVCEPAWSCGRLARGEAGMKKDVWYLKYEDVDGPARLEIGFAADAACLVDGASVDCALMNPPSGSASSFRGAKEGELFTVSRMEFTTRK